MIEKMNAATTTVLYQGQRSCKKKTIKIKCSEKENYNSLAFVNRLIGR
jgi:hypothetical protein